MTLSLPTRLTRVFTYSALLFLTACDVSPILTVLLGEPEEEYNYDYTYTGNTPIINDLVFNQASADTSTDLSISFTTQDYDYDVLTNSIQWFVNNSVIASETSEVLSSSYFNKSDVVKVVLSVSDGVNTTTDQLTITIADAPPELSIVGDASTITYGSTLSFKLSATDPDGEAIPDDTTIILDYGPSGMTIDSLGNVTWTASAPLFSTSTVFKWGASATSSTAVSKVFHGSTIVNDATRKSPLSRSATTISDNPYANFIGDLNNDGITEILSTDHKKAVFTLINSNNKYIQEWLNPFNLVDDNQYIASLSAHDTDNDNFLEIFIGTNTNYGATSVKLLQLNGKTRLLTKGVDITGSKIDAIKVADLDNDGDSELVLLVTDSGSTLNKHLEIRNISTLDLIWSSGSNAFGAGIAIANIDNDNTLEIITSGGYVYGVLGSSFSNEWIYGAGFGYPMTAGDINNDNISEIIGHSSSSMLTVTSAITKSTLIETYASTVSSIIVTNVDSDPDNEIVTTDFSGFQVISYDDTTTPTLTIDANPQNLQYRPYYIAYEDVDNDGQAEFILGNSSFIIASTFTIAGPGPDYAIEWQNTDPNFFKGPFTGGNTYTLSAGGNDEIVFACKSLGITSGKPALISMNPSSGELSTSSQFTLSNNLHNVTAADYDADGVDEFFITNYSYATSSYVFDVFNFLDGVAEWSSASVTGTLHYSDHGDMNNDGNPDFIALFGSQYSSEAYALHIYDVLNSTLLWNKTFTAGEYSADVLVKDLDNDSILEVILATSQKLSIYKKSGGTYIESKVLNFSNIVDVEIGYLKNDQLSIVVYQRGGYPDNIARVIVYDTNLVEQSSFVTTANISDITIESNPAGINNLLLSKSSTDYVTSYEPGSFYLVDPYTGDEIMHSPSFTSVPKKDSVHYIDLNNDGVSEITYATDYSMNMTR